MPERPVLIFDLDDTLAATGPAWRAAEERLLRRLNLPVDEHFLDQLNGRSARDVVRLVHDRYHSTRSLEECEALFTVLLTEAVEAGHVQPRPGAVEAVRRLAASHRLAIASGSTRPMIGTALRQLGLADAFECIVSSNEVAQGKPSPLVFLAAAERMAAAPSRCVVIEDSLAGAQAAQAAGMVCVAIPSRGDEAAAIGAIAQRVLPSLEQLDLAALAQIRPATPLNSNPSLPCPKAASPKKMSPGRQA